MAAGPLTTALHEHPQALEVARLLVRQSDVSLPEIASVLGFPSSDLFAQWFETRAGRPPERDRAGDRLDLVTPPDDMLLCHVRRTLIAPIDLPSTARLLTTLRGRQPLTLPGGS